MRTRSKDMWWGTAIEAPDPYALAAFYSQLLDWPIGHVVRVGRRRDQRPVLAGPVISSLHLRSGSTQCSWSVR